MPSVARFNLAPVKSAQLSHPDEITLTLSGAVGDRRFLFLDPEGHRFSGEAKAGLLGIGAYHDPATDRLTLTFPDGSTVAGSVTPTGTPFAVALYDHDASVRSVEGPLAEVVSAHIGREVHLGRVEGDQRAGFYRCR